MPGVLIAKGGLMCQIIRYMATCMPPLVTVIVLEQHEYHQLIT
jgi:hypothetical protein